MHKISKVLLAVLVASFLFFSLSSDISPQQGAMYLKFKQRRLSANIKETPLRAVLDRIKQQKRIWIDTGFMRNSSLLDEQISVRFRDLPIQDGLERILSGMNHCLIFDEDSVVGVMLFGKPAKRTYRGRRRTIRRRR